MRNGLALALTLVGAIVCLSAQTGQSDAIAGQWTGTWDGAGSGNFELNLIRKDAALAGKVERRNATMVEYHRIRSGDRLEVSAKPDAVLTRTEIFRQIRPMVTSDATIVAETGDSCRDRKGQDSNLPEQHLPNPAAIYCGR